ncbi:hypothetical protein D9M73_131400 [compost metagenome]
MQRLGLDPEALQNAAGRARSCGRPDAVRDLADLVESLGDTPGDMPIGAPRAVKLGKREAFA